jgi:hypothetical protein
MLQVRPIRLRVGIVRLAWLAALLGMVACPLTYKGGAESPHAHAVFQLIYDAAHGSIDHHHDGDGASDDDTGEPLPAAQSPAVAPNLSAHLSPMSESADGLALALAAVALWLLCERERWSAPLADAFGDGQRLGPEPPPPRHRFATV